MRQSNRWAVVAGLMAALLAFALFRNVRNRMGALSLDPREGSAQTAIEGAADFHHAVSSGKAKVCESIDASAFQSMTGFPCAQFVSYLHGKLGKAIGPRTESPPVVQPTRVILDMVTQYERGDAQEHFEYSRNGPSARLINYRIQAEALNH